MPSLHVFLLQVIYALNTKNDEHEAAIATLKEAHEEEVQQILSETREKILQVYTRLLSTFYTHLSIRFVHHRGRGGGGSGVCDCAAIVLLLPGGNQLE